MVDKYNSSQELMR